MKVNDYKCNMCGTSLTEVFEMIGFGMKQRTGDSGRIEYYPRPVEKASYHICRDCMENISVFARKYKKYETMTSAEKHGWELDW